MPASSLAQAIQTARYYVDKGYSVDLGLGQINSRNMKALGLTWENVFDPCTNLAAAGAVLDVRPSAVRGDPVPPHGLTDLAIAVVLTDSGAWRAHKNTPPVHGL